MRKGWSCFCAAPGVERPYDVICVRTHRSQNIIQRHVHSGRPPSLTRPAHCPVLLLRCVVIDHSSQREHNAKAPKRKNAVHPSQVAAKICKRRWRHAGGSKRRLDTRGGRLMQNINRTRHDNEATIELAFHSAVGMMKATKSPTIPIHTTEQPPSAANNQDAHANLCNLTQSRVCE